MGKDGKWAERARKFAGRATERSGKRQGMRGQVAIATMARKVDKRPKRPGALRSVFSFCA